MGGFGGAAGGCGERLVGHDVEEDIDSEGVGAFFGEFGEVVGVGGFFLPAVAHIGVVVDHDHDAGVVIEDGAVVGFLGIGAFPGDTGVPVAEGMADVGDLGFGLEAVEVGEDGVIEGEVDGFAIGEDAFDDVVEGVPFLFAPEVIDPEEAAGVEVIAECGDFGIAEAEAADAAHPDEGEGVESFIGEADDDAVGVDDHGGEVLEAVGEVEVGVGEVGFPGLGASAGDRVPFDSGEGPMILLLEVLEFPGGDLALGGAVPSRSSRVAEAELGEGEGCGESEAEGDAGKLGGSWASAHLGVRLGAVRGCLFGHEVEAPEAGPVADIEFAIGDGGVGPGFGLAAVGFIGGGEHGDFAVGFGVGLEEGDLAVIAVEDEVSIDGEDGAGGGGAPFFPGDFAGFEMDTEEGLVTCAVEVISDEDGASGAGGEAVGEVDLLGGEGVTGAGDFGEATADAAAAAIDEVILDDGGEDDGGAAIGGSVIGPEDFTGLGFDTDEAFFHDLDDLVGAVDGGGDGGAIAGFIGAGEGALPGGFTREFIEGEEGGGGAAGATDDEVIDDEGGFGVGPGTGFAVVFGGEVGGPEDFAGGLFEAGEVAIGA
ncbi:MAG: hypothetical protein RI897_1397 [Verrucomicrobiota bacterium]